MKHGVHQHRRAAAAILVASTAALLLSGCSPAIDWREMRVSGAPLQLVMPCRPASHQREVSVAGGTRVMTMVACAMDDGTFALAHFELVDLLQVGPALDQLAEAARSNVQGSLVWSAQAQVRGMTPQSSARQWRIDGRLPDGRGVVLHGMVFSYGTQVFQASVIGDKPDEALVKTFFGGLAIRP